MPFQATAFAYFEVQGIDTALLERVFPWAESRKTPLQYWAPHYKQGVASLCAKPLETVLKGTTLTEIY